MSALITSLNNIDEYEIYREVILTLEKSNPDIMKEYYNRLNPKLLNYLKQLMQSKRVGINIKGEDVKVPRKIYKAARRIAPQVTE